MRLWRDSRHQVEKDADDRYKAAREGRPVEVDVVSDPRHIAQITNTVRAYTDGIKEGKRRMSVLGKLQHLTEDAQQFNTETESVLDGISEKIALARQRRDVAKDKHHGYYDGIIKGVEDSVTVIDRLSNGPLHEDGQG